MPSGIATSANRLLLLAFFFRARHNTGVACLVAPVCSAPVVSDRPATGGEPGGKHDA